MSLFPSVIRGCAGVSLQRTPFLKKPLKASGAAYCSTRTPGQWDRHNVLDGRGGRCPRPAHSFPRPLFLHDLLGILSNPFLPKVFNRKESLDNVLIYLSLSRRCANCRSDHVKDTSCLPLHQRIFFNLNDPSSP